MQEVSPHIPDQRPPLEEFQTEFCRNEVCEKTLLACFEHAVPAFGDWLVVELCSREKSFREPWILHRNPNDLTASGLSSVLRLNHLWEVSDGAYSTCEEGGFLRALARDPQHLDELSKLNLTGYVSVPLGSTQRLWGWVTIFSVQSPVAIHPDDLTKMKAFAACAATALDLAADKFKCDEIIELKNKFVSMVSHELRAPLNVTLGWSSLLLEKQDLDDETKQAVEVIYRNTREQAAIISNLLDSTRFDLGKLSLDLKEIHLASCVEQTLQALSVIAKDKGVQLKCQIEAPFARIMGDPVRLHQVLQNLIVNAIKFTPAGGDVTVKVAEGLNHVVVSVIDTGDGIAKDFLPQVFDRYKQRLGKKTYQPGLGLGLSIVRELVQAHGGEVSAQSDGPSRGSIFTFKIPKPQAATDTGLVH